MSLRPVLVVDDDPDLALFLVDVLASFGVHCDVVGDGETALRVVRQIRPSLVLLDMHLPGLSGRELVSRLKAYDDTRAIPVVGMSSLGRLENAQNALQAGCDTFLLKPFGLDELADALRTYLPLNPTDYA